MEKTFFKLMNNAVFGKTIENVRKLRDIKLVTSERRRNYLVSEPNYRTTKFFTENLLAMEMKKTKMYMNTLTKCSCHVTYVFQSESTLYICLNVKEFLAWNRREIWSLSDCNWTRTHDHLVRKRTLNHLASLAKWLSVRLSTK